MFKSLHRLYPDRIVNKTNGITPRRWLIGCNPGLAQLLARPSATPGPRISSACASSSRWPATPPSSERFQRVKRDNKERLAALVRERHDLVLDPAALFDVQIKRIHEYKRQLLNLLEAVALWASIREAPAADWTPRVKLFAGKAASSATCAPS